MRDNNVACGAYHRRRGVAGGGRTGVPGTPDHTSFARGILFCGRRMGVLALLNEECIRPKGSDGSLISKVRHDDVAHA